MRSSTEFPLHQRQSTSELTIQAATLFPDPREARLRAASGAVGPLLPVGVLLADALVVNRGSAIRHTQPCPPLGMILDFCQLVPLVIKCHFA